MSYTSWVFVGFVFAAVLLYYVFPKRIRWTVLLAASVIFYAAGGGWYLPFIAVTVVSTHVLAWRISKMAKAAEDYISAHREEMSKEERKAYKAREKRRRLVLLVAALVFNFGILAVMKYTGFTVDAINGLLSLFGASSFIPVPNLLLPLGISFYTFRATGYIIDVYRGRAEAQKNIFRYALFVSFFPLVLQGPISRYSNVASQLFDGNRLRRDNVTAGLFRILWGYFKKVAIADTALVGVRAIIANEGFTGVYALYLIIMYSVVIYGDFTGGIDITMGIARLFGIKLEENFKRPFSSRSTQEYWNRWHITMGAWFTDYLFYPMSVSKPMGRLTKWCKTKLGKGIGMRLPVYLATLITWYLTGLWHGAGWNFIVWGLINGVIILISRELEPLYAKFHNKFPSLDTQKGAYGVFCAVRTFLLMGSVRILDCYGDVGRTFSEFGSIFYRFDTYADLFNGKLVTNLGISLLQYVFLALAVLVVFLVTRRESEELTCDKLTRRPVLWTVACTALVLVILIFGSYGIGFDSNQFIYNQF